MKFIDVKKVLALNYLPKSKTEVEIKFSGIKMYRSDFGRCDITIAYQWCFFPLSFQIQHSGGKSLHGATPSEACEETLHILCS